MQQMQPTAPRNSNLRELPIAPSHVLEMSGNRCSSTPVAQVKSIVNTSPPCRAVVSSRSSQGNTDAKAKPLSPEAQPKEEAKPEAEVGRLPGVHCLWSRVLSTSVFCLVHSCKDYICTVIVVLYRINIYSGLADVFCKRPPSSINVLDNHSYLLHHCGTKCFIIVLTGTDALNTSKTLLTKPCGSVALLIFSNLE